MISIFISKSLCSCPFSKICSPLKYAKRQIKLGNSNGDYDTAKINFDNDYHKSNPADINNENIIKRNDDPIFDELSSENDFEFSIVTQNVLNYYKSLRSDLDSKNEEMIEEAYDQRK